MILTRLAFEEVNYEISIKRNTHLSNKEFGKAPERLNTIHVVFPASDDILMMMNPMMSVTNDNFKIRPTTVRVNHAISQNLTFNDGPLRVVRVVIDNFYVHTIPLFQWT